MLRNEIFDTGGIFLELNDAFVDLCGVSVVESVIDFLHGGLGTVVRYSGDLTPFLFLHHITS